MPESPRTIMLVATEPSATRLGAALMEAWQNVQPNVVFIGMGGAEMQARGLVQKAPAEAAAVMGLAEVIPAIPRIRKALKVLAHAVETERPALVLTIDGQDFAARLAKATRHLGVPHVQYVAPKVWAWRQGRVHSLAKLFTHILSILPFEAPFFAASGLPTTYVGHPMVSQLAAYAQMRRTQPHSHTLALLPGSRAQEWAHHWPIMLATYRRLRQLQPTLGALLVVPDAAAAARCRAWAPWAETEQIEVVVAEQRFAALATCRAALAKSGTNNLELAVLGVPAVVCYRMHALTYAVARWLVKIPYVSLPNVVINPPVMGQKGRKTGHVVYPEFIQKAVTPENLARALVPMLAPKPPAYVAKGLAQVAAALETPRPPAEMALEIVLNLLEKPEIARGTGTQKPNKA